MQKRMSELTPQECAAGISRRALDTIRRNGNGAQRMKTNVKTTQISASENPPKLSRTETFTELSTTKMTSIVCTPYRTVEVLEGVDGMFCLRETSWQGHSAHVSQLWLKPYEMLALRDALNRFSIMEAEQA